MVIVIVGPTGVGKTKMSIELAKHFNGEIINADSTQVYKYMNIGTAKVTEEEKENIPHHLIDIKEVDEDYSVYDYQQDCRNCINSLLENNKMPILVGGTGLYIKSALYNYDLKEEQEYYNYDDIDNDTLYKQLKEVDPNTNIHPNNRRRVERALSYYKQYGIPFSQKEINNKLLYNTIFIGLTTDRDTLYKRINDRVDQMIDDNLIDEAKYFYNMKIRSKAIMTPICYKELFEYFDGNLSKEEAIELIKKRSRNYAKRQYTWFNNQMNVTWFNVDFNNFSNTVNEVISYIDYYSQFKIEDTKK